MKYPSLHSPKYSVNSSVECAKESTNYQSDLSNLNQHINQPIAYSLQPIASIRSVGRIVHSLFIIPALLTLIHSSTSFAMDPKVVVEVMEEIGGLIEKRLDQGAGDRLQAEASEAQNISSMRGEYWINPSEECARGSIDNQSDLSNLNQSSSDRARSGDPQLPSSISHLPSPTAAAVSPAYSFQFIASHDRVVARSAEVRMKATVAEESGTTDMAVHYRTIAEKLASAAEFYQRAIQAGSLRKKEASNGWNNVGMALERSAEMGMKAIEAEEVEEMDLATQYKAVVEKLDGAAELFKEASQAYEKGKTDEGNNYYTAANATKMSAEIRLQVIRVLSKSEESEGRKLDLAAEYSTEAEKMDRAVALFRESSQAYKEGKTTEGNNCYTEGDAIQVSVETMLKAIEAGERGKLDLAEKYQTEVKKLDSVVGLYKEACQACEQRKKNSLFNVGLATKLSAEMMVKAIEAGERGNLDLVEQYKTEVKKLNSAADLCREASQAYEQGKKSEGRILFNTALLAIQESLAMMQKDIGGSEANVGEKELQAEVAVIDSSCSNGSKINVSSETGNGGAFFVTPSMDRTVRISSEIKTQAIVVEEIGNADLAAKYRTAAEKMDGAIVFYNQANQVYSIGQIEESRSWHNVGGFTQSSAERIVKAIEARESGNVVLAEKYEQVAARSEQAAELSKQAAKALALGRREEGVAWYNAGAVAQLSAERMVKAIEAGENGNVALVEEYKKAAAKSEESAELNKQAANAYASGKREEGMSYGSAGISTQSSAETIVKSIEAKKNGKVELAEKYEQAVLKLEKATELNKQAAEIFAAGKRAEGTSCHNTGVVIGNSAEMTLKAIETEESGNENLATKYRMAADKLSKAVVFYTKATQAHGAETRRKEGLSWDKAGEYTRASAESQLKALEAGIEGNIVERDRKVQAAVTLARAAKLMEQSAEAYVEKKKTEGVRLYQEAIAASGLNKQG